jgi:hypothetical protein
VALLTLVSVLAVRPLRAQVEPSREPVEALREEVIINKDLKLELPPAERNFSRVPPDQADVQETEPVDFHFRSFDLDLDYTPARLRVLKLKEEKKQKYSGNYLAVGIGNYLTPYLAAGLNSSQNRNGLYGLNISHLSSRFGPVDSDNSASGRTEVELIGKHIGQKASIQGDVRYRRDRVYFYGYPEGMEVSRDTIRQTFNRIGAGFELTSTDIESPFRYHMRGKALSLADDYDAREFGMHAEIGGDYQLDDRFSAGLVINADLYDYTNTGDVFRSMVKAHPSFNYVNGDLSIIVGLRIVYLSDTLNYKNDTRLYPVLQAGYTLDDRYTFYAGLKGDMENVSFHTLTDKNPFLNTGIPLVHTSKRFELSAGVEGVVFDKLDFDVGFKVSNYKNLFFFVNDTTEQNKFNVLYDGGNTLVANPHLTLSYDSPGIFGVSTGIGYNFYNTGQLPVAWHRPRTELLLSGWYNLFDKVRLSAEMYVFAGIDALDTNVSADYYSDAGKMRLPSFADFNISAEYNFSKRYKAFVNLSNIFGNNYQYFLQYPNRGLQAMIGFSIDF